MRMEDILKPTRCLCGFEGRSKQRLFYNISALIAAEVPGVDADAVFQALMAREQLGSTGLGQGIAIPHCRVEGCSEVIGLLVTLREPINFDAMDDRPVDLLFFLVVPETRDDDHVRTLASVATLFNDADFCSTLRNTSDVDDLYTVAVTYQA